jgi:hypothetical protein
VIKKDTIQTDDQPASGHFERELLEQLKDLHQSLLEENRQLRELLAAQKGAPAPRRAADDYLDQWEQRRRRQADRLQGELLAGDLRFRVSHPGDPQRLVGAADGGEAVAKYRRHFGILRTSHEFTVEDVSTAPDESACLAAAN